MKKTALLVLALAASSAFAAGPVKLLNVSYDPTRELYQTIQRRVRQTVESQDRWRM